jgi:hypothetical protein
MNVVLPAYNSVGLAFIPGPDFGFPPKRTFSLEGDVRHLAAVLNELIPESKECRALSAVVEDIRVLDRSA